MSATLMAAGMAMQAVGSIVAAHDEAKAHTANAEHAEKMAEYNQLVGDREEELFREELQGVLTGQEMSYSKAGVDMSGSALVVMASTLMQGQEQIEDIRLKTKMNVEDAQFKAAQDRKAARNAKDPARIALKLGGSALSAYGASK